MKVVVYHSDSDNYPYKLRLGLYKDLVLNLKKNVNSFGFSLIHLTTNNMEGWGDENYFYDLNPDNIVYNREICFTDFIKNKSDNNTVYWFTEPDSRINNIFPNLKNDIDFLFRNDKLPITPAWRLAKKTSYPIFEDILSCFNSQEKSWNGDSDAMLSFYNKINSPNGKETIQYKNCSVGFRDYKFYCMRKSLYTQQYKAEHKEELLERYKES